MTRGSALTANGRAARADQNLDHCEDDFAKNDDEEQWEQKAKQPGHRTELGIHARDG